MTRKEEIEREWFAKSVQSNHRYDEKTFREAVEWADKTMIEKACEWLKHQEEMIGVSFEDDFIERFKKEMEE